MLKQKTHQNDSHCGCFLIIICSIIFSISFIKKNIYLSSLIPDNIEERSGLTVQYYDTKLINNSFISFTNLNPDLLKTTAFKEDITEAKWVVKKATALIKNQTNSFNNKCQMCGTEYQNPSSNSSKRDLILALPDLSIFKLRFISSLRASRCQATIVLFVSNRIENILTLLGKITDNCGVIIINISDFSSPYSGNKEISYHILFHEFLKEFRSDFDRVVILNPSSVSVQTDPFTTYFTYSTVGITTFTYNDRINYDQIQTFNLIDSNYSESFYESKGPYLSSSILYGSVDGMLMFYGILFTHSDFQSAKFCDEQHTLTAYINYFYHRGIFEQNGLKLFIAFPGHFISSVEQSGDFKILSKSYFASPFDVKRKAYFTLNYYREVHSLNTIGTGLNPPAIIGISSNDPFHSIRFYGCSNIFYKKRLSVSEKKKQNYNYKAINSTRKKHR